MAKKAIENGKYGVHPSLLSIFDICVQDRSTGGYKFPRRICCAKDCINLVGEVGMNLHSIPENTSSFCSAECYIVTTWGRSVDVDWRGASGRTALMNACRGGSADAVNILLVRGADINALSRDGNMMTSLHYACHVNSKIVVEMLLKRIADKNVVDKSGATPLMVACNNNSCDIARLLLKGGGCDVRLKYKDRDELTLIKKACSRGFADIARLLIENKAISSENNPHKVLSGS